MTQNILRLGGGGVLASLQSNIRKYLAVSNRSSVSVGTSCVSKAGGGEKWEHQWKMNGKRKVGHLAKKEELVVSTIPHTATVQQHANRVAKNFGFVSLFALPPPPLSPSLMCILCLGGQRPRSSRRGDKTSGRGVQQNLGIVILLNYPLVNLSAQKEGCKGWIVSTELANSSSRIKVLLCWVGRQQCSFPSFDHAQTKQATKNP